MKYFYCTLNDNLHFLIDATSINNLNYLKSFKVNDVYKIIIS